MGVSHHTVDTHVRSIDAKFKVHNLSGTVARAIRLGLACRAGPIPCQRGFGVNTGYHSGGPGAIFRALQTSGLGSGLNLHSSRARTAVFRKSSNHPVMKTRIHSLHRAGFTLVEMLVVIVIIVSLAALSFVVVGRAREAANRTLSLGNLRQLGIGITSFTAENNGYLPLSRVGSTYWPQVIFPYIPSQNVFLRPGSVNVEMNANQPNGYFGGVDAKTPEGQPIRWNYVINGGHSKLPFSEDPNSPLFTRGLARSLSTIEQPERTVFIADGTSWWLNAEAKPDSNRLYRWKNGSTNVLFGDGSTRNLRSKTDLNASQFLVD